MRIISKFKDYYDSAASFGVDLDWVYERTSQVIPVKFSAYQYSKAAKYPMPTLTNHVSNNSTRPDLKLGVLGFCGKFYPYLDASLYHSDQAKREIKFYYSLAEVQKDWNDWGLREKSWVFKDNSFEASTQNGIKRFFEYSFSELEPLFSQHHAPLFLYRIKKDSYSSNDLEIELNPKLSDREFFKVKDAATTFQDIFMFLSGVLGKIEKDTVKIADKDKIQQHGFDHWSFRKMPGSK